MLTTLASLLHDIGKFYQRTNMDVEIKPYYKYLVKSKNKYQYHHAAFTALFIDTFIYEDFRDFKDLASSHHLNKWTNIKKADIIASSHDRRDSLFIDTNTDNLLTTRLFSIFNEININENKAFQFVKIDKLDNFIGFVEKKQINYQKSVNEYRNLFIKMCKEILNLGYNTYVMLHHLIYPVIKNYTFAIPANTYNSNFPTVGLFDHLKLTTAIANCLNKTSSQKPYIIVKYQLKNISKYIFCDNDLKKINKRSLYVNFLSDFICFKIIDDFKLTYENVLYAMSGQGRLLLYNCKSIKAKLNNLYQIILKFVKIKHQGIIDFVLSYDIYDDNKLMNGQFKNQISENEKFVLKSKVNNFDFIRNDLNFDFGFNTFAFDYYNNNWQDSNIIDLLPLGKIVLNPQNLVDDAYYFSVNQHLLGEGKYYSNLDKLSSIDESVLLMFDIDKLRLVFKNGITNNNQSISKFLTLSRFLEIFFGKIIYLIAQEYDDINLIYSGGDNIIIIIPKNNVEKIVSQIVNRFNEYIGFNKHVRLKYQYSQLDSNIYATYIKVKNKL